MSQKDFQIWLQKKYKLGEKSSRDVASRVKRSSRYVDLDSQISDDEVLFKMGISKEFKMLSTSVKSQLRRAVKLHREFKRKK